MKHPDWKQVNDNGFGGTYYERDYGPYYIEVGEVDGNWSVILAFTDNDETIAMWDSASKDKAFKEAESYVQRFHSKIIAECDARDVYAEICGGH
jgi:hypothetical protein